MTTAAPRPKDDDEATPASVFSQISLNDPQVRALRIAVIVMGVMIVMGLVAVIGRIIYLMARPSGQAAVAGGAIRADVTAALPAGAQVRNLSLQGDRIAIHYESAAGSGIAVVDLASGRTLSRIQVVPEPPKP